MARRCSGSTWQYMHRSAFASLAHRASPALAVAPRRAGHASGRGVAEVGGVSAAVVEAMRGAGYRNRRSLMGVDDVLPLTGQ